MIANHIMKEYPNRINNRVIVFLVGPTIMGGATISFKLLVDELIKLDLKVIVIVSNKNINYKFIEYLKNIGCKIEYALLDYYIYPTCNFLKWEDNIIKYPLRILKRLYNLRKGEKIIYNIIKKINPDVVHTNIGVLRQGYYACKKLNIPHIFHLREYQDLDFSWLILPSKKIFSKILKTSNVITITKNIHNHFNLSNNKNAVVMWDGILSKEEKSYVSKKEKYFLSLNRISREKGVDFTIKSFVKIAHLIPDYKLIIVGLCSDQDYLLELKKIIIENNLIQRVLIKDFTPDIKSYLINATALIVSSQNEGLGRMTLEAIFYGCLVLGRNTGGTKEILEVTNGGFLFDDIDSLSQLMLSIIDIVGTNEYFKKIEVAQYFVVNNCSIENYAYALNKTYKDIIEIP